MRHNAFPILVAALNLCVGFYAVYGMAGICIGAGFGALMLAICEEIAETRR